MIKSLIRGLIATVALSSISSICGAAVLSGPIGSGSSGSGSSVSSAYGAIYLSSANASMTLSGTPTKITIFNSSGSISNQTIPSHTLDTILISSSGVYDVYAVIVQTSSAAGTRWRYNIGVNDVDQEISCLSLSQAVGCAMVGQLNLVAGSSVTLKGSTNFSSALVYYTDAQLIVSAIGGSGGSGGGSGDITDVSAGVDIAVTSSGGPSPTVHLKPGSTQYAQVNNTAIQSGSVYLTSGTFQNDFNFTDSDSVQVLELKHTDLPRSGGIGPQTVDTMLRVKSFQSTGLGHTNPGSLRIWTSTMNFSNGGVGYPETIISLQADGDTNASNITLSAEDIGTPGVSDGTRGLFTILPATFTWKLNDLNSIKASRNSGGTEFGIYDTDGSNYVALKASSTIASDFNIILPSEPGTVGQVRTVSNVDGSNIYEEYRTPSSGGGSGVSVAFGIGTATGSNNYITYPTTWVVFNSAQFTGQSLSGGSTFYASLNGSSVTLQGVFTAGTGITFTPNGVGQVISATVGGAADNLGSHVATMTITAGFGINATTGVFTSSVTLTNRGPGVLYVVSGSSIVQSANTGVINVSTNPVDWTLLKNVPAGFADGTDDGGAGGGGYLVEPATVTFKLDKGVTASTSTVSSTATFNGSIVLNSSSFTKTDAIGAGAFLCGSSLGCYQTTFQTATTSNTIVAKVFPYGTTNFADVTIPINPARVANSTFTVNVTWTSTSTTGNVVWKVQSRISTDTVSLDGAFGSNVSITDGANGNLFFNRSGDSPAMTPGGSNDVGSGSTTNTFMGGLSIRITRDADAGNTMTGEARLLYVSITYLYDRLTTRTP